MNKYIYVGLGVIVLVGTIFALSTDNQSKEPSMSSKSNQESNATKSGAISSPFMLIDKNKTYTAQLKTSEGVITIELHAKETPVTVNNFVYLARSKFYNDTIFHRVIKGFMIQGGDPDGNGRGGPGYTFEDEPFSGEYTRGILAMANAGPDTNGSQFFIMHQDYGLQKDYVIFGTVTQGLDIVDKIATAPVKSGGEGSSPVEPVTIESVTIVEK